MPPSGAADILLRATLRDLPPMPRRVALLLALGCLLLTACAGGPGTRAEALDRALYAYSAAIRWNQFEVAAESIDPATLARQPLTAFELERLQQNRITGYQVIASRPSTDGGVVREVELRIVNIHTQVERVLRVRETWRWDDASRRWLQTEGLPRFARDG